MISTFFDVSRLSPLNTKYGGLLWNLSPLAGPYGARFAEGSQAPTGRVLPKAKRSGLLFHRSPRKNFRSSTTNSFRRYLTLKFYVQNPAGIAPRTLVPIKTISLIFKIMMNYNPWWCFSEFPKSSVAVMNARKFIAFSRNCCFGVEISILDDAL